MAKQSTHPVILENRLSLSTKMLNSLGVLKQQIKMNKEIFWRSTSVVNKGELCGSINLKVNTQEGFSHIELDYTYERQSVNYIVQLEFLPSNLGIGQVIYFICPSTSKRCRKLYLYQGYFLSRYAIKNHYYEQQLDSKKNRADFAFVRRTNKCMKVIELSKKLYYKSRYRGKNTKSHCKVIDAYKNIFSYICQYLTSQ